MALLCRELMRRGCHAEMACQPNAQADRRMLPERAREMGVTVHDTFRFDSRPNIRHNRADVQQLRALIHQGEFDLVHCHGTWDHFLAAWALGRHRSVPLLRSDHRERDYRRMRWFYASRMADHMIVLGDRLRARVVDRIGRSPDSVTAMRGAVDTSEFRPIDVPPGTRERYGLAPDDFVIGLVARVQPHRRFDVLLDAMRIVHAQAPHVRVFVFGRGTRRQKLLLGPAARMGLGDTVLSPGYIADGYRDALAMLDAGMMLVPGTDGACRAAMQMAAMGKPLVVAERGALPDIVLDGRTGIVVKDTPERLAEAILKMVATLDAKRAEWGAAARSRMTKHFSLTRQVDMIMDVYARVTAGREHADIQER
jgi:L-malate glycosyltransferase